MGLENRGQDYALRITHYALRILEFKGWFANFSIGSLSPELHLV